MFDARLAVKPSRASPKAMFRKSQSERAASEAGSDNCDLANSHEVFVLKTVLYCAGASALKFRFKRSVRVPQERSYAAHPSRCGTVLEKGIARRCSFLLPGRHPSPPVFPTRRLPP